MRSILLLTLVLGSSFATADVTTICRSTDPKVNVVSEFTISDTSIGSKLTVDGSEIEAVGPCTDRGGQWRCAHEANSIRYEVYPSLTIGGQGIRRVGIITWTETGAEPLYYLEDCR